MGSSGSKPPPAQKIPSRTASVAPMKPDPSVKPTVIMVQPETQKIAEVEKPPIKPALERDSEVHKHVRNSNFHYQQMPRCRTCRQIQWDYEIAPNKIHGFTGHKRGSSPPFDEFGRKKKGTKETEGLHEDSEEHPMAGMRVGNGLLPAKPGVNVGRGGQHKSWTAPSDALGYDNQTDFAWRRERLHIFPDEMGFPGFGRLKPQRDTSAPPAPRRMPNSEFAAINDFFSPEDIKVNEELRRKQKKERHRSRKLRRKEETEGADDLLDWLKNGNDADEHLSHDILFGRNSFVAKNRRHKPTLDDEEMLTEQLESDAIPPAGVLKTEHPRMLTQQQKEEILRQAKLKEGEICWDCGQVVWYENMEEDDDDEL